NRSFLALPARTFFVRGQSWAQIFLVSAPRSRLSSQMEVSELSPHPNSNEWRNHDDCNPNLVPPLPYGPEIHAGRCPQHNGQMPQVRTTFHRDVLECRDHGRVALQPGPGLLGSLSLRP